MPYFDANNQTWKDDAEQNMTPAAPIPAPQPAPAQPATPAINPITAAQSMSDSDLALLASIRRSPGTPGVTQQQLQRQSLQGVATPQSQVNSVSGASPEALDKLQAAADARVEAIHDQSIADKLQANANLDNASAQAAAARQAADQQAVEQARRDEEWQAKWQQFQQQNSPENNQVDPNRFFARQGVLGSILSVIGSMYEARGAALSHTQNPQTVMRMIDNDIRAQQLDLMQKGQASNTKFAQLSREYGSVEAGRAALKTAELQAVEAKLRETAAQTNDPALKAHIDAQAAQAEAAVQESAAQFRAAHEQVASQQQAAILYPRKATGGGTSVDYGKLLALKNNLRDENRKDMEARGKQGGSLEPAQATNLAEIAAGESQIEGLAKAYGLKYNAATGEVERPEGWKNPIGLLSPGSTRWADPKNREINAKNNAAVAIVGKALMGNMTKDEHGYAEDMVKGTNPEQTPDALNALSMALRARKKVWESSISPESRANAARNSRIAVDAASVEPYQPKVGK